MRIVLDTKGRTPLNSLVVTDKTTQTIIVTTSLCPVEKMKALKEAGVRVILAPLQDGKTIYLPTPCSSCTTKG